MYNLFNGLCVDMSLQFIYFSFFCNALLMTSLSLLQRIDLNEWRQNRIKTALYSELE